MTTLGQSIATMMGLGHLADRDAAARAVQHPVIRALVGVDEAVGMDDLALLTPDQIARLDAWAQGRSDAEVHRALREAIAVVLRERAYDYCDRRAADDYARPANDYYAEQFAAQAATEIGGRIRTTERSLFVAAVIGCDVCGEKLTAAQIAIAQSRGAEPRYCSPRCRRTAARRRERAKQS